MPVAYQSQALTLLENPDEAELCAHLLESVVHKILRHLDPATGSCQRGEVECTKLLNVVYNRWSVEAFYATIKPDGKGGIVEGTQFMRFFPWSAVMRCLAVTTDGRVVLLQEYRRGRGAWVDGMHVAGGIKQGDLVDAVTDELFCESGCKLTPKSTISSLGAWYMDDGVFSDPLHLLVVDQVEAPESHQNPDESIRGIRLVPWDEWQLDALEGRIKDVYATIFAMRVARDPADGSIYVCGQYETLRFPE